MIVTMPLLLEMGFTDKSEEYDLEPLSLFAHDSNIAFYFQITEDQKERVNKFYYTLMDLEGNWPTGIVVKAISSRQWQRGYNEGYNEGYEVATGLGRT